MNKSLFHFLWITSFFGILVSCGNSTSTNAPETEDIKKDSVLVESSDKPIPPSKYADLLEKFKPISFDTLEVEYWYDTKDKRFIGRELTLKEAKLLPIGLTEKEYYGKLSGVYACYQFLIDSSYIGLIARIPAEYEATTVGLFFFDIKKDQLLKEYFNLSASFGDAGDAYQRTSWLFRGKNKQFQSFVYDYSSYNHEVEDTTNHTIDIWKSYYLINCSSPKFDTISKNEIRLKKQFKNLLKKVE